MKRIASLFLTLLLVLATVPAMAEGPVEITMWTLFSGEDGSTMEQIVADFNASQSDVHLSHVIIDYTNLMAKLALAIGDDSSCPQLIVSYASDIAYLADAGRIQPLEETFAAYPEFDFSLERYNPACAVLNMYNDKRYAVTLDFPSEGMYVNMELANQYCPEVLEDNVVTWDEVKVVGAKLQADGVEDVKVMTAEWALNDMLQAYLLYADTWASDDAQELKLDSEAMINGVSRWKECYDAGYLWQEGEDCAAMFADGRSIFFTGGNWCMNAVREYGFDFRFIAAPQLSADKVVLYGDAHSFMQPTRTYSDADRRAIAQWIAYFYEHSLDWAQAGSLIAASEPRTTEEFAKLPQAFVANSYEPYNPVYKYNSIFTGVVGAIDWQPVYGYMSPEDYVDAIVKQVSDSIAAQ